MNDELFKTKHVHII